MGKKKKSHLFVNGWLHGANPLGGSYILEKGNSHSNSYSKKLVSAILERACIWGSSWPVLPFLNCVNITEFLLPKWASVSLFGKSRRLPPTCEERPGRARWHTQLREEAPSTLATISSRALPGMSVLMFPSGSASSSAYRCSLTSWWNRPLRQSCGCSRRWEGRYLLWDPSTIRDLVWGW